MSCHKHPSPRQVTCSVPATSVPKTNRPVCPACPNKALNFQHASTSTTRALVSDEATRPGMLPYFCWRGGGRLAPTTTMKTTTQSWPLRFQSWGRRTFFPPSPKHTCTLNRDFDSCWLLRFQLCGLGLFACSAWAFDGSDCLYCMRTIPAP